MKRKCQTLAELDERGFMDNRQRFHKRECGGNVKFWWAEIALT
jgi:hypothetical protein